ncbi:7800_t:CDS:1, partial [Acaulospora colombiana]
FRVGIKKARKYNERFASIDKLDLYLVNTADDDELEQNTMKKVSENPTPLKGLQNLATLLILPPR